MKNFKEIFSRIKTDPKVSPAEKLMIAGGAGAMIGLGKFLIEGGLYALLINLVPFTIAFLGGGLLTIGALRVKKAIDDSRLNNKK